MNRMPPSLRWNCRAYAAVLLLYPATLRRQFGQEMIEVFADQMRAAWQKDGWAGGVAVWSCVSREALVTALSSHLQVIGISFVSGVTALGLLCTLFWATFAPH
jgi:hypothetical protein